MFGLHEYSQFEAIGILSVPLEMPIEKSLDSAKNKFQTQNHPKEAARQLGLHKRLEGGRLQEFIEKTTPILGEKYVIPVRSIPFLTRSEYHRIAMQHELPYEKKYELSLMTDQEIDDDDKIKPQKLYIRRFDNRTLEYAVFCPDDTKVKRSFISVDQLPELSSILTGEKFEQKSVHACRNLLEDILRITSRKGHTEIKLDKGVIYLLKTEKKNQFTAYWLDEGKRHQHHVVDEKNIEALGNFFTPHRIISINQPNFHVIRALCGYTPPDRMTLWYRNRESLILTADLKIEEEWQLNFTDQIQFKSILDLPKELAQTIKDLHESVKYHNCTQFAEEALKLSQRHDLKIFYARSEDQAKKLGRKNPDSPILFEHENKFILRGNVERKWHRKEITNWGELKEGLELKSNLIFAKEFTKFHQWVVTEQLHVFHSIDYPNYVLFNKTLMMNLLSKYKRHQETLDVALGKEFDDFSFHVYRYALYLDPADIKNESERVFIAPPQQRVKLYNAYLFILLSYAGIIKNNSRNYTKNRGDIEIKNDKLITPAFETSHMRPAKTPAEAMQNARAIRAGREVTMSSSIDGYREQRKTLFAEVATKSKAQPSKAGFYDQCLGKSQEMAARQGCIVSNLAFISDNTYSFTQIPRITKDTYQFQIYNSPDEIKTVQPDIFYVKAKTAEGLEYMVMDSFELVAHDVIPVSAISPALPGMLTTSNITAYWPAIRDIVQQRGQIAMQTTTSGHIFYSLWQNSNGKYLIHHLESMLIGKTEGHYKLKEWTPIYNTGKGTNKQILCYTRLGSILNSEIMEPLASELVLTK